jgi:predicted RNA-binding Zn-ribbon protein involved in translation (DUF1610 family)
MRETSAPASMQTAVDPSERATKICPDCAEEVLAAARKCRFCGFRFDAAPPRRANTLTDLVRKPKPSLTVSEQIGNWGIALTPGEQVETLDLCEIGGEPGFVIRTDRRLLFVPSPNPSGRPYDAFWFGEMTGVAVRHRRLRMSELVLKMPAGTVVVQHLGPGQLKRLGAALASSISADAAPGESGNARAELE